jgi:capsular polysaccharide biosynthesis protein
MDNQNGVFNILSTALVAYSISNINGNTILAVVLGLVGCGLFFLKEYLKSKGYTNFGKKQ